MDPRDLPGARRRARPACPTVRRRTVCLSDPGRVRSLLTDAGFTGISSTGPRAGLWFGNDADDAHRFTLGLMGWMLEGLDDTGRARAIDALHATMAAHATPDGVVFGSAAWTIEATRP